jgi:chromosome partitioning protein
MVLSRDLGNGAHVQPGASGSVRAHGRTQVTRRISVVNEKGGVGKTTTAVNLAVGLAQKGLRVLLIDLDPQRNASMCLGLSKVIQDKSTYGTADLLMADDVKFSPQRDCVVKGLDVVPFAYGNTAPIDYALLNNMVSGMRKLLNALSRIDVKYDFIISDCPPNLGMLVLNAVIACPEILIPVELAPLAMAGAVSLRAFLTDVRLNQQPDLHIMGVLGTFHSNGETKPREALELLGKLFGDRVFKTQIHASAATRDASGVGRPVIIHKPKDRVAQEYMSVIDEVLERKPVVMQKPGRKGARHG